MPTEKLPDLIAAGELLIDMISTDFADNLEAVADFRRLPGGSPANLAGNLARLGQGVALVATVGSDDAGQYLADYVAQTGVDITHLRRGPYPTSLILVTRSREVSRFEPYRTADQHILPEQFPADWLRATKIFHTTCFALSLEPARSSILAAARLAAQHGARLSIDINYASKLWPDTDEARRIVAEYLSHGALVKCSEVDWERLYGSPLTDTQAAAARLMDLGADTVCLTLGDRGCYVANAHEAHFLESRPIDVKDTTGAGDAFWSGFLCGWLDELPLLACAKAGRAMAERKLTHFGPLPGRVAREAIYE
jgi:fructokinase